MRSIRITDAHIADIIKEIADNDLECFTFAQVQGWAADIGFTGEWLQRPSELIQRIKAANPKLTQVERLPVRKVRGVNSNPHTRWQDCPSHGGGGGSSINGMAGREG